MSIDDELTDIEIVEFQGCYYGHKAIFVKILLTYSTIPVLLVDLSSVIGVCQETWMQPSHGLMEEPISSRYK